MTDTTDGRRSLKERASSPDPSAETPSGAAAMLVVKDIGKKKHWGDSVHGNEVFFLLCAPYSVFSCCFCE